MKCLSDEQLSTLLPAETSSFPSPVPTQIVSSDEYLPVLQSEQQREVEARLYGLQQHAEIVTRDRFAALKADYDRNGPGRSNLRYGYVTRPA